MSLDSSIGELMEEEKHQVFTPRSHVWIRPGMYVGSRDAAVKPSIVLKRSGETTPSKLGKRGIVSQCVDITRYPAFEKVADEILANALDRVILDSSVTTIKVHVNKADGGSISVYNDGSGIPVLKKEVDGKQVYIPEMVFSHFRSGSNFKDADRFTGGMNGYGAKLTNVLSRKFTVETADGTNKFTQTWTGPEKGTGMRATTGPKVKACSKKSFTRVTFTPYYNWFGMPDGLTAEAMDMLRTRVLTAACNTTRPLTMEWVEEDEGGEKKVSIPAGLNASIKDLAQQLTDQKVAFEHTLFERNESLAVACIIKPPGSPDAFGYVNSLECSAGTHIKFAASKVSNALTAYLKKRTKKPELAVSPKMVEKRLFFIVAARVSNPAFDSQTKDQLCTSLRAWNDWTPGDAFIKIVDALIGEELVLSATQKETKTAASACAVKKRVPVIKDYDPATLSGKSAFKSGQPVSLILTEGLSAKALATACKSVLGATVTGIYPLRGKLKNVRGLSPSEYVKNAECKNLASILGLEPGRSYGTRDELLSVLNYTNVWIFTDQDPDGDHICGLILNLFDAQWPSLLQHFPHFMKRFRTPLLKVLPAGPTFFSRPEFDAWRMEHGDAPKVKYYKGLGTSTSAEGKSYASNIQKHLVHFDWTASEASPILHDCFNEKAEARKKLLTENPLSREMSVSDDMHVPIREFAVTGLLDFYRYANRRCMPDLVSGLKPAQAKALYTCLKMNLVEEEKVSEVANKVASVAQYHHGSASMSETIIYMAQNHWCSGNNINLLYPSGQFGSRLAKASEHSSDRYLYTRLEPITRYIFRKEDDALLKRVDEDGVPGEPVYVPVIPMSLVNSVEGIGAGWSTTILPRNPADVIQACTILAGTASLDAGLEDVRKAMESSGGLKPWFYGLKTDIVRVSEAKFVSKGSVVRVDDATVHITELPVGVWTDEYLAKLRESEYEVDARHTDLVVDIRVKVPLTPSEDLHEALHLSTPLRDGNMHGYSYSGHLVKAETVYDILRMHALERLKLYAVRLESEIQSTQATLLKAASKQKFIELVLSGALTPYGKSKAALQEELRALGIDTGLLSMDLWSFTLDAVHALSKDMDKMRAHVVHLKSLTPGSVWLAELTELGDAYAQFVKDREQATIVPMDAKKSKKRPASTELSGRKSKVGAVQA